MSGLHVESVVRERYAAAAQGRTPELCCPVEYDRRFLAAIPDEVLERDYGCGDPSRYVAPGDTVLDLGSGGGKICFIAAQVVGPTGRVIGVDSNDAMLALARRNQPLVAERIGYANTEFRKGRIQDLQLDVERWEADLRAQPVRDFAGWLAAEAAAERLRTTAPLIADASIDVVVSNCVLNLVHNAERRRLFTEILRVLKPGGRAVISDIVADRDVPASLQRNPELWSGCISGAFREDRFPQAFVEAGFCGVEILDRPAAPWTVVEGIEFRSLTVRAWKPATNGAPIGAAVIYRGPWCEVVDDRGQRLVRGVPTPVAADSHHAYASVPALQRDVITVGAGLPTISGCCSPTAMATPLPVLPGTGQGCCGPSGNC